MVESLRCLATLIEPRALDVTDAEEPKGLMLSFEARANTGWIYAGFAGCIILVDGELNGFTRGGGQWVTAEYLFNSAHFSPTAAVRHQEVFKEAQCARGSETAHTRLCV